MRNYSKVIKLNRRDFLKLTGIAGTGLIMGVLLDACSDSQSAIPGTPSNNLTSSPTDHIADENGASITPQPSNTWEPNIYFMLDSNGVLTVIAFRSEMGQGVRTALAMLIADELDMPWESVRIVQAAADRRYGDQVTGGSQSITTFYNRMRTAGAVARQMLVLAAAQSWGVEADLCQTSMAVVIHPDGHQIAAYGDLVEIAKSLDVPIGIEVKKQSDLHLVGTDLGHWVAPDIITGKAIYGLDIRVPNLLFAAIARCPVFGGSYISYDEKGVRAVPGVRHVIALRDSIAVVAENSWAAIQGRNVLNLTWDEGKKENLSSPGLLAAGINSLPHPGSVGENELAAIYEIPYEAHASMEPMNCTAFVSGDKCEIWAPTQNPQAVQNNVSSATKIPQKNVTVHVPLIGGGFGRRLQSDYAVEAAQVSQAIQAPVQVFWTREDDVQHDYYHEMNLQYVTASLIPVEMPHITSRTGSGVPTGAWRSVGNFNEAFATQCFIDEMAIALQRDPLDLRLELYRGRALEVIKLAAEKAGWGDSLPEGWGRGLAYHATFGVTHVAQVADVFVNKNGNMHVSRVLCAVDCGKVVNPDNVVAQMEGGIVFGLTATLKARITLENGRVQQSNFHDYPLLQMSEMPVVEVYIIDSDERPSGIGEMAVPPIAPAIANAVFAATGKRVRKIPIFPEDLL